MSEEQRANLRLNHVSFVFQGFQLLANLTALENVMLPSELRGDKDAEDRALKLLDRVELSNRVHHQPNQLSGESNRGLQLHGPLLPRQIFFLPTSQQEIWIQRQVGG